MDDRPPLILPVHYDFASTLCYVAHRVLGRMSDFLEEIAVELAWTPIDLSGLMGWRPGAPVSADRLADIQQIAEGLGVPVHVPHRWQDSTRVGAATLALELVPEGQREIQEATWRERVFTAVYEQGHRFEENDLCDRILAEMGLACDEDTFAEGLGRLEAQTRRAAADGVTGVPTFMLGSWPFGGIQDEQTMRSILRRFAEKERRASLG